MRRRETKSINPGIGFICLHPEGTECPRCGERLPVRRRPRFSRRGHRVAKVGVLTRDSRSVPMLRLSGRWLAEAGFETGQEIEVHVQQGTLTIMISPDAAEESGTATA
jgi:hypothetical protein